jgi:large subunit ribosomal protein L4
VRWRRQEAVASEGHRARSSRLDACTELDWRWRTVFGPTPRKYTKALPKKMQRLALRSALSSKLASEQIVVIDQVAIDTPKTKTAVKMLSALGVADQSVLLVTPEKNVAVWKSVHNLPQVKLLQFGYLNIRDLLGYDLLLLTREAVDAIELWLGADAPVAEVTEA